MRSGMLRTWMVAPTRLCSSGKSCRNADWPMTATSAVTRSSSAAMPRPSAIRQFVIGIIGTDTLDGRRPVAVHLLLLDLSALPDQLAHPADRRSLAADRHNVSRGRR